LELQKTGFCNLQPEDSSERRIFVTKSPAAKAAPFSMKKAGARPAIRAVRKKEK